MLFSTPLFLFVFLPILLICYFSAPKSAKNLVLLIGSLAFFLWGEPLFTWVVISSALLDWYLGNCLGKSKPARRRLWYCAVGVSVNLSILLYYKYTNFFVDNLNVVLQDIGVMPFVVAKIMLPLGVSFIVFEKITYLVDIYRRVGTPSSSLLNYLVYVFLFPKLLAGPIVKYHEIEQQLQAHSTRFADVWCGLCRFIVGLAKKVFIADTMAEYVDAVFALPANEVSFIYAWLGALCFTIQIYFDFAGYSDMAIGLARMFGFRLRENFNLPYLAINFTDFWQRWHISLSTWIKEYLYIPLGGNRVPTALVYRNLLVAFLLSGLWHGANWTFIVWGAYHGCFLIIDRLFWRQWQQRLPRLLNTAITFLLVVIGWVIFRAPDIGYAYTFITAMLGAGSAVTFIYITNNIYAFLLVGVALSFAPLAAKRYHSLWRDELWLLSCSRPVLVAILAILAFAKVSTTTFNPFLYFRF